MKLNHNDVIDPAIPPTKIATKKLL